MASSRANTRTRRRKPSTPPPPCAKPPAARNVEARFERAVSAVVQEHRAGDREGAVARATNKKEPFAVAVSGGGDSIALMHLLARAGHKPAVLTVDHGLRKTAAADAKRVAQWAKKAGLKAHVLVWRGAKPKTGIEAAAREARYRLMGAWLKKHNIATLLVGHTQDDQAETFLLRLARGSGLDGLAAMQPRAPFPVAGFDGLALHRPLLDINRAELRDWLTANGHAWLEDPMNDDPGFDRVKMRRARAALEAAGLSSARIAAAAAHLARARTALEVVTDAVLARASRRVDTGFAIDPAALTAAPREVGLRALAALLMAAGGQAYRPRFEALERLFDAMAAGTVGGGVTLHGCRIAPPGRGHRDFRAQTLLIQPENRRKTGKSTRTKA